MAGLAFLPWEKWIASLLRALLVAFKRRAYRVQRKWFLARSERWPEIEGTIEAINWTAVRHVRKLCTPTQQSTNITPVPIGAGSTYRTSVKCESAITLRCGTTQGSTTNPCFLGSAETASGSALRQRD